ncbi:MAG: hypothetical protein ACRC2K_06360 [Clostridium sp.]
MSTSLPIRDLKARFLAKCYINYLLLVIKTSKIEFENEGEISKDELRNCILGFWHGDSCVMNIVLDKVGNKKENIKGIVTADRRGDFIENILFYFGAKALRMPDGIKMRGFLRDLIEESKESNSTIAIALDGPLGPLHEAKKIGFLLANESGKSMFVVRFNISKTINLRNRWDNYKIPLPFTRIGFSIIPLGKVTKEKLKNFKEEYRLG